MIYCEIKNLVWFTFGIKLNTFTFILFTLSGTHKFKLMDHG